MLKISVIVPNYNHGPYLKKRLDSILSQTYQEFELIVLDDCSTDNSREIIDEYRQHPNVSHIVYNSENSGTTFQQWEKGIMLATGDYIWIAESDDWCEANLLETLVDGVNGNSNCVVGYAQSYTVWNENDILWQSSHKMLKEYMDGKKYIRNYLLYHNTIFNASMAIFKKSIFNAVSKDFKNFKFSGDWLFWIEASKQGDVFISGKLLNFFRKHNKNVSGRAYSSGSNFTEDLKILDALYTGEQVDDALYKKILYHKYSYYLKAKKDLSSESIDMIEQQFFKSGHKLYLFKRASIHKIRMVLKRMVSNADKQVKGSVFV